jgi:hypothetical protein
MTTVKRLKKTLLALALAYPLLNTHAKESITTFDASESMAYTSVLEPVADPSNLNTAAVSNTAEETAMTDSAQAVSDSWQFKVTPYIWGATLDGDLKREMPLGSYRTARVNMTPNDYFSALNFVMMLNAEARKGQWGVSTDFIYLNASAGTSSVRSITGPRGESLTFSKTFKPDVKSLVWQLDGFYNVMQKPSVTMDVLVGFRNLSLESSLDWGVSGPLERLQPSGKLSVSDNLLDGIVGIRGQVNIRDSKWFVPYYLDVGTGSSSVTWQASTGIGYATNWGDVKMTYRHLYYDQSGNKLLQNFNFSGPMLSATIKF